MSANLTINTRQFQQALKEYAKVSKADGATILNRFGVDVAFRAIINTPKARQTAKAIGNRWDPSPPVETYPQRFHYANLTKLGKSKKGKGIEEKALATYAMRKRSPAYIKAGWFNCINDLGGFSRQKPKPGGTADKGYGVKATASSLISYIYNFSVGGDKVGADALQEAVNYVARKKLAYAKEKLAKRARKFSGKRR